MHVGGISHVVGFDDAPFSPEARGDVMVVGAVFCGRRLEGVLRGKVRRDGANATRELARMVRESRFAPHLQAVLLQGIALAGFNVVDIRRLHRLLGLPVLVVSRRAADLPAIEQALLQKVSGGPRKWRLVQCAGPMEALAGVYVQRVGIERAQAGELIRRLAFNSAVPEPLRTAHLIAGGMVPGGGRHRV